MLNIIKELRNHFLLETQRFKDLMKTMKDFDDKVTALTAHMQALAARQVEIRDAQRAMLSGLADAVSTGHSELISKAVDTMDAFDNSLGMRETTMETMHTELKSGLAAVPTTPSNVVPPAPAPLS